MVRANPVVAATDLGDFAALVREHQAMVFSLAYHFLRERAAAEELAQDVFLQLHRCLDRLESPAHVVFWLRRVTAHRCIDAARRRGRRPEVPLEEVPEASEPAALGDPLLRERLRKLVGSLPEQARLIVLLRFQEDLEPAEIARVLKLRVNTVKSQLQRALTALRQKAGSLEW